MGYPVIVEAIRTPFGRRTGAFRDVRPDALLAATLARLIERSGVEPDRMDDVIAGCVSQAGEQSANVARQVGLLAGLPVTTGGFTLNRMCGSGQTAVHIAAQAVAAGDSDYVGLRRRKHEPGTRCHAEPARLRPDDAAEAFAAFREPRPAFRRSMMRSPGCKIDISI